ncbi:hypothetical protein AB0C47_16005 [Micromonospora taraxaci]|uniref:hypothetical protein n=1 Tax=Micromonospora taraxaci TaxID=1316803 RepID=UPI0033E40E2B
MSGRTSSPAAAPRCAVPARAATPVARVEPQALLAELALKHHDLVSQSEDLDVLGPVARRR